MIKRMVQVPYMVITRCMLMLFLKLLINKQVMFQNDTTYPIHVLLLTNPLCAPEGAWDSKPVLLF